MFQLTFENLKFSKSPDFEIDMEGFPLAVRSALEFCKSWLVGKSDFEQQTSGSTGAPKNISISRIRMIASAKATQGFFQTNSESNLLCCLDAGYIAGKMMLVRAMIWDCQIRLVEPNSNPLLTIDEEDRIDFIALVPLQVQASLLDAKSLFKLKSIKNIIIGGASISEKLKADLIRENILGYQTYGMTETVSHVALAKIESDSLVYNILPGVEIGLDDRGALWIISPMSGDDKIQTNDLVDLISDHEFRWLGRADFVINSGGVKIHPEQLETKVSSIIDLLYPNSRFFFFGIKNERLGEELKLFIENDNNYLEDFLELKKELNKTLTKYEIPKSVHILKEFVLTKSLKINRLETSQLL